MKLVKAFSWHACLPTGHALVFAGFLLPWVSGEFGVREQLSGLDLARIAFGLEQATIGRDLGIQAAEALLVGLPILTANAMLLLAASQAGMVPPRTARAIASTIAGIVVAIVTLVLMVVVAARGDIVRGPAPGLFIALGGGALALAPPVAARARRAVRGLRRANDAAPQSTLR